MTDKKVPRGAHVQWVIDPDGTLGTDEFTKVLEADRDRKNGELSSAAERAAALTNAVAEGESASCLSQPRVTRSLEVHTRAAVQAIVDGGLPPEPLVAAAQEIVDKVLTGLVRWEAAQPKRAAIRRRTKSVREAAQFIVEQVFPTQKVRRISDPKVFSLREFLLNEGEHWLEHEKELLEGLISLVERCDINISETSTKGGQGRPFPAMVAEHTASGSTVCALAVSLLWQEVHGRVPGVNNGRALEACSELWRAADGDAVRRASAGWRVNLQEAREPRFEEISRTIATVMSVQGIKL